MRYRSLLLASVASSAIGLATAASGADMPVYLKAPPPVWSWTGFYLGGNVGYGWGKSDTTVSFFDPSGNLLSSSNGAIGMDGVIGGGQIGYNWQNRNWVWGLETDLQASGQKGSGTFVCGLACGIVPGVSETINQKLDWFGTVRGRLGYTVTPTVLLYGTGGLAYGDIKTDGTISDPAAFSVSTVKTGWTAGVGVEARIVGNWTAKIEYLFMDLGHASGSVTDQPTGNICSINHTASVTSCQPSNALTSNFSSAFTDNIVRVGVNYKFN